MEKTKCVHGVDFDIECDICWEICIEEEESEEK